MPKLAIPQTPAEMQEMMDDPKIAAQIIGNGQLSEFVSAYAKATDTRGQMTDMVVEAVKATMVGKNEIADIVAKQSEDIISKVLSEHGVNRPQMSADGDGAKTSAMYNPLAPGADMQKIGFANIGDFTRTVFNKGRRDDPRIDKAAEVMNAYSSMDPATGGFLIPEDYRSQIMELALESEIVAPRASVITMSTATTVMPYVDQTTHSGSLFGGMTFNWTEESGSITPDQAKFGRVKLVASKLTGMARIPNELWADAPALSSWLMRSIPQGLAFKKDESFLVGNGVGQPLGVQNAANTALITITKETGQAASTIVTQNILKMYARMLPQSLGNAVWLANPKCFPQLMQLTLDVGTGGAPVAMVDIHSSPNMTLLGRPLILTEKVPSLTSAGDIGFYDFSFYMVGDRQAISLESSTESRFANDETELRAILRVDGRPWIQSALTPLNGDTLSPFVILGAR